MNGPAPAPATTPAEVVEQARAARVEHEQHELLGDALTGLSTWAAEKEGRGFDLLSGMADEDGPCMVLHLARSDSHPRAVRVGFRYYVEIVGHRTLVGTLTAGLLAAARVSS